MRGWHSRPRISSPEVWKGCGSPCLPKSGWSIHIMFDFMIVGAGFAGSFLADRLARAAGMRVLICDVRPHIGGNAYDEYNDHGILIHKYGPHIFHTNSKEVFDYLSQ